MSVPKSERGLSQMEFYRTAIVLRERITFLLLRDFGVKPKVKEFDAYCAQQGMNDDDKAVFATLLEKYNLGNKIVEQFPSWFIDKERSFFDEKTRELIMNITMANAIFITSEREYDERRICIDKAIGNCDQLLQEMQFVIKVLPVNVEKLMPYVELIKQEIALLKGLRKNDNKALKKVREK